MEPLAAFSLLLAGLLGIASQVFRRVIRLSPEERKKLDPVGLLRLLYGLEPREAQQDPLSRMNAALDGFRGSTQQLESAMAEVERAASTRSRAVERAEDELRTLEAEQKRLSDRITTLGRENPEAARVFAEMISEQLQGVETRGLRQQVVVSAAFFLVGVGATILVALLVAG